MFTVVINILDQRNQKCLVLYLIDTLRSVSETTQMLCVRGSFKAVQANSVVMQREGMTLSFKVKHRKSGFLPSLTFSSERRK